MEIIIELHLFIYRLETFWRFYVQYILLTGDFQLLKGIVPLFIKFKRWMLIGVKDNNGLFMVVIFKTGIYMDFWLQKYQITLVWTSK